MGGEPHKKANTAARQGLEADARPRRRGRGPSAQEKGTAGKTGGIGDKKATEGCGPVIIEVFEVNPVLNEFGLAVHRRLQPRTSDAGEPAVSCLNRLSVNDLA